VGGWGAGAGGDVGSDVLLRVLPRRRAGLTSTGDTISPPPSPSDVLWRPVEGRAGVVAGASQAGLGGPLALGRSDLQ
jgi:hypothetical protein